MVLAGREGGGVAGLEARREELLRIVDLDVFAHHRATGEDGARCEKAQDGAQDGDRRAAKTL